MTRDSKGHAQVVKKLQGKLDKCNEFSERLELAKKWRLCLKEVLQGAGKTLENSARIEVNIVSRCCGLARGTRPAGG